MEHLPVTRTSRAAQLPQIHRNPLPWKNRARIFSRCCPSPRPSVWWLDLRPDAVRAVVFIPRRCCQSCHISDSMNPSCSSFNNRWIECAGNYGGRRRRRWYVDHSITGGGNAITVERGPIGTRGFSAESGRGDHARHRFVNHQQNLPDCLR